MSALPPDYRLCSRIPPMGYSKVTYENKRSNSSICDIGILLSPSMTLLPLASVRMARRCGWRKSAVVLDYIPDSIPILLPIQPTIVPTGLDEAFDAVVTCTGLTSARCARRSYT